MSMINRIQNIISSQFDASDFSRYQDELMSSKTINELPFTPKGTPQEILDALDLFNDIEPQEEIIAENNSNSSILNYFA